MVPQPSLRPPSVPPLKGSSLDKMESAPLAARASLSPFALARTTPIHDRSILLPISLRSSYWPCRHEALYRIDIVWRSRLCLSRSKRRTCCGCADKHAPPGHAASVAYWTVWCRRPEQVARFMNRRSAQLSGPSASAMPTRNCWVRTRRFARCSQRRVLLRLQAGTHVRRRRQPRACSAVGHASALCCRRRYSRHSFSRRWWQVLGQARGCCVRRGRTAGGDHLRPRSRDLGMRHPGSDCSDRPAALDPRVHRPLQQSCLSACRPDARSGLSRRCSAPEQIICSTRCPSVPHHVT